jgi:DNA-binding transcriptional LysR family regulator
VERQEIEAFLTLCEELHFGRTATRMRISPARVTQLIQKTERRIGAPLFERTARGVVITDLGRQLHRDLGPAHRAVDEAVRLAVQAAKGIGGELRLGFLGTANGRHLAELVRTFEARHPGTQAHLPLEAEVGDHLRPLRADRVDLLATFLPVNEPDLVVGPVVLRESLVMAVPDDHPIAIRGHSSFEDLDGQSVILAGGDDYWVEHFVPRTTPSGRLVDRTHRIDSLQAGLSLILAGKGIGPAVTQFAMYNQHPGITYVPLDGGPVIESALIWSAARETELIRSFARLAEAHGPVTLDWSPAAPETA